jgi:hypothetical protein
MLAGTFVYVNAGTELARITSTADILSPTLIGAFVLLGIFPLIAKAAVGFMRRRRVYKGWRRPKKFDRNLIVIGAGAGGLVTAYIAATVRAKVTLIEANRMGGDCLNTGCVPSKALIRSARLAHEIRTADYFGLSPREPDFDFKAVMKRIRTIIEVIEPADSVERYTSLGVDVRLGYAKIVDPWTVEIDGTERLTARAIVIAAVDGVAMGGGFELVLSADLVIATRRSRFGLPEVTLGLIPGWGGTQRLTRHLGPNRTKRVVLLGEPLTTAEAYEAGIVTHVVPPEELAVFVEEFAAQLATRAPLALAAAKAAITAAVDPTAGGDAGSALETRLLLELFASEDGREGVAAFTEKRGPVFVGR